MNEKQEGIDLDYCFHCKEKNETSFTMIDPIFEIPFCSNEHREEWYYQMKEAIHSQKSINNGIYLTNIENALNTSNDDYRVVLNTTKEQQLVLMTLQPKGNPNGNDFIEKEKHDNITQFIRIEEGEVKITIYDDEENDGNKGLKKKHYILSSKTNDDTIVIPGNTWHKIVNNDKNHKVKLYTVYSPPVHH